MSALTLGTAARTPEPAAPPLRERAGDGGGADSVDELQSAWEVYAAEQARRAAGGDRRGAVLSAMDMAQIDLDRGQYARAFSLFHLAQDHLMRRLARPDTFNAAAAMIGAAYSLTGLGRTGEARQYAAMAHVLLAPYARHHRGRSAEALGAACAADGEAGKARSHWLEALDYYGTDNDAGHRRVTAHLTAPPAQVPEPDRADGPCAKPGVGER